MEITKLKLQVVQMAMFDLQLLKHGLQNMHMIFLMMFLLFQIHITEQDDIIDVRMM